MPPHRAERIAVFVFGVVFVILLIVLALFVPKPTPFQYTVFRIVLALAAAGVAAFIPGFIDVEISNWLRAGGAIAVFVIVYFFSPAKLVTEPLVDDTNSDVSPGRELTFVTDSYTDADRESDTKQVYFTVWNRHPKQRIRISNFKLVEVARIPRESYCCPERRSELTLAFGAEDRINKASSETYEIPPLSSNSFVATIRVKRGVADNNPVVFFGIGADYSTPSGNTYEGHSDKIYLANYKDSNVPLDRSGLITFLQVRDYVSQHTDPAILSWFPCPWSDSFLPAVTSAFSSKDTNIPARSEVGVRPAAPIAKVFVKALEGYGSLYPQPLDIEVSDFATLTWSDFKRAFPVASLGCDGQYVVDKYDGRIVRLTVTYTNEGNALTMLDPEWLLSSNGRVSPAGTNELLPEDVRNQPVSPDYPAQRVDALKTRETEWIKVKPGHPQKEVLYFKPIVESGKPIYLTDSGLQIYLRIR